MLAIITENAPPRLRGRLSLLLLEVRAGVYLGAANAKVRNQIWDMVVNHIEEGSAVMVWPNKLSASGVAFTSIGDNRRSPIELDGLLFVRFEGLEKDRGNTDQISVENTVVENCLNIK